VLMVEEAHYKL